MPGIFKFAATLATMALSASAAIMDDLMSGWGYTWEWYTANTEDDWALTVFRITGKVGENPVASTKPPLLIQHGATMDAALWISM